jgi:hypothetical protein
MSSRLYSLLVFLGIFGIIAVTIFFIASQLNAVPASLPSPITINSATTSQSASALAPLIVTTSVATASAPTTSTIRPTPPTSTSSISTVVSAKNQNSTKPIITNRPSTIVTQSPINTNSTVPQVARIQNPYSTAAKSFTTINTDTRAALVNILCMPRGGGSLAPISGSGVIIDPRGVILTNAHVAQYVLLSEDSQVNLSCQIRIGAPATAAYTAEILYIPPVWVNTHVSEINTAHPMGTGEHDYALLRIVGATNGAALPSTFPYLPFDTREAIGFTGDQVLGASYPAEFLGGMAAENSLYAVSSISPISQLLTFVSNTVDVISIGGVVEAQSGSSGGPVVNQWGYLLGIIATTSDAPTTAARDLRAITLSYINRDITALTGYNLATFLNGDLTAKEDSFNNNVVPGLLKQYIQQLSK